MARREQAACDVYGKDRNCACWDFVVRKNARGRIAQFTPGTDTVYYENGREVGRSRNTTYAVGSKRVSAARGTAHICMPCRIIRSLVYGVLLGVGLTLLAAGFVRAVEAVIVGAALFFLGGRLNVPTVTAKLNLARAIGLVLTVAGALYLLLRNLLAPSLLKKTPWKIVGNWDNATLNPVPVGDGYYRDYRDFKAINPFLGKDISEKIYSEIIETGAWKALVETAKLEQAGNGG